jgi:hypothetical protein
VSSEHIHQRSTHTHTRMILIASCAGLEQETIKHDMYPLASHHSSCGNQTRVAANSRLYPYISRAEIGHWPHRSAGGPRIRHSTPYCAAPPVAYDLPALSSIRIHLLYPTLHRYINTHRRAIHLNGLQAMCTAKRLSRWTRLSFPAALPTRCSF